MTKISNFSDLNHHGEMVEDNELFTQYTNEALPHHYDSNYVVLKFSPSLLEFQLLEKMHQEYQKSIQQNHLQFKWPDNTGLQLELLDDLDSKNYKVGMQYLYEVTLALFKLPKTNKKVTIQKVNDKNFADFLKINLEEDALYGEQILKSKKALYSFQYLQETTTFLLAYRGNTPVGSLILFHSDDFLEIDNVLTRLEFRGQKVASTLLTHVMYELADEAQLVLLAADAEDTVKELYEQMGFQYRAYQISAQKSIKGNPY